MARYHESKKGRSSPQSALYERHMNEGDYSSESSRREMEMEDGGMIRSDHSKIANLPQEVMIKPWPVSGPYLPEGLDDTIRGVDHQMDEDDRQRAKHNVPKKIA